MHYLKSIMGIGVTIVLIVSLLLVNLVQTLSLIILPFSKNAFRRFNGLCARFWWGIFVFSIENVQGVQLIFTGDILPKRENAILIANHSGLIDPPLLLCLAHRFNRLADIKFFVKDILKFVPGVGWGLWFLNNIFLKRNWTADRASIEETFKYVKDHRIPIWLASFIEGTRLTRKKLLQSQEYARKNGLPILNHVLIPRTKGFVASIVGLEGHIKAVYDITIGFVGKTPSLLDLALCRIQEVHIHIRRIEIATLPNGEVELSNWAIHLFEEKDALLETFSKAGSFV